MADCTGFIAPLNLQCIFVNMFAGSMELFMVIIMMFIAGVGAYFQMLNVTLLIMYGVFAILFSQWLQGIYLLVVLIAGLVVGVWISRIAKR